MISQHVGQFKYPAVQRYLHDLSTEMGDHLDNITATLSVFIEIGMSYLLAYLLPSFNIQLQVFPPSALLRNTVQPISSISRP